MWKADYIISIKKELIKDWKKQIKDLPDNPLPILLIKVNKMNTNKIYRTRYNVKYYYKNTQKDVFSFHYY